MNHGIDEWTSEAFDDRIVRSLCALYETNIYPKKVRGIQAHTVQPHDLLRLRRQGIVVPAPDRIFLADEADRRLDPLMKDIPQVGCVSGGEDRHPEDDDLFSSYCVIMAFRRIQKLPAGMSRLALGLLYEVTHLFPQDNGIVEGLKDYVTVQPTTYVMTPCFATDAANRHASIQRRLQDSGFKTPLVLNFTMQIVDDLRHQWTITAEEGETRCTVGAYAENVKSLLYARSLPMTPSGRKRPILHVVSSHRRRLREGTEIDISAFLRGTREIEMNGTRFTVQAPQRLIDEFLMRENAK